MCGTRSCTYWLSAAQHQYSRQGESVCFHQSLVLCMGLQPIISSDAAGAQAQRHPEAGGSQRQENSRALVVRQKYVLWKHHYPLSHEWGWWEGAGGPVWPGSLGSYVRDGWLPKRFSNSPFSPAPICPTAAVWLILLMELLWRPLLLIWQHFIYPASSVMSCFTELHFPDDWTPLLWAPKFSLFSSFWLAIFLKCFKHLFSCLAATSMVEAYLSDWGDIFIYILVMLCYETGLPHKALVGHYVPRSACLSWMVPDCCSFWVSANYLTLLGLNFLFYKRERAVPTLLRQCEN